MLCATVPAATALVRASASLQRCAPVQTPLRTRHPAQHWVGRQATCRTAAASREEDEVEPVPPALLSSLGSDDELAEEAEWLGNMIRCWLDEEWPAAELVQVHADLGAATGKAYFRLRSEEGLSEVGDLVLSMVNELLAFNFGPTFVNAFDVTNKASELLMLRAGCDVCCTSEADRTAISRYEAQLAAEKAASAPG